jgi:hypothetical protein
MNITQVTSPGTIAPGYGAFVTGSNLPLQNATIVLDDGSYLAQTITPTSYNGGVSLGFVVPSGTNLGSHSIVVKANGTTSNSITFMVSSVQPNAVISSVVSPGSLSPGYNAFVTGSNLPTSGATIVIDDGSASALTVTPSSYNNSQSISFVIPANITLGSHSLDMRTSNGTTNSATFTVVAP